jgi:hypothetical protein
LPRLSIQRVAMGQSCDVSRLAAFLPLRITTRGIHHKVSCKYSRSVRLSASGSSRSPAESRLRRTNWSISASRNSINKQRSPLRRRARCRCMRSAAEEGDSPFAVGDASAVVRSSTISAPARRGEFASSLRAENTKISRRIASNGFLNFGFIGSSATNTRSVGLRVQTYSALEGRDKGQMKGPTSRCSKDMIASTP